MGGPSNTSDTSSSRSGASTGSGDASLGRGRGGGGAGGGDCPDEFRAILTGTERDNALTPNMLLDIQLDTSTAPSRVVAFDPVGGVTVGSLSGIPNLVKLIACIADGVGYRASVTAVDGGRVDVLVVKQS